MGDLAGIIELAIEEARKAQARKMQARGLTPVAASAGGQSPMPPRVVSRQRPVPGAAAPSAATRPAPSAEPSPFVPFSVPGAPSLEPVASVPVPLLLPFRDRSALLASIVVAEALAPPLGLQPRRLPSE